MSYVYFIKPAGRDGPIKIGFSTRPRDRIVNLAMWSPERLEFIGIITGTRADEGFLHACFADLHSHHEWFFSNPELRTAITEILIAGNLESFRSSRGPQSLRKTANARPRTWTPDQRRWMSFAQRISWVERKLSYEKPGEELVAPDDVRAIMYRWLYSRAPSEAEIGRLEDYIKAPTASAVKKKPPLKLVRSEVAA